MIGFYVWVLGLFGFRFGSSPFECLDLFRLLIGIAGFGVVIWFKAILNMWFQSERQS